MKYLKKYNENKDIFIPKEEKEYLEDILHSLEDIGFICPIFLFPTISLGYVEIEIKKYNRAYFKYEDVKDCVWSCIDYMSDKYDIYSFCLYYDDGFNFIRIGSEEQIIEQEANRIVIKFKDKDYMNIHKKYKNNMYHVLKLNLKKKDEIFKKI